MIKKQHRVEPDQNKTRVKSRHIPSEIMQQARALAKEILKKCDNVVSIIICGSYAEGMADSHSDFDIVVISDQLKGEERYNMGGIEASVEYVPANNFEQAISEKDFELIRWIKNSIILYDKQDFIKRLRSNVDNALQELAISLFRDAVDYYKDSLGSLESSNLYAGIISARLAAQSVIELLLISQEKFNLKERWLFNELKGLDTIETQLINDYLSIQGVNIANVKTLEKVLILTAQLINRIVNGEVLKRKKLTKAGSTKSALNRVYRRNPLVVWFKRADDRVQIYDPKGVPCVHELNETGARVWMLLDGRHTLAEIIRTLSKEYARSDKGIMRDCLGFVRELGKMNLID